MIATHELHDLIIWVVKSYGMWGCQPNDVGQVTDIVYIVDSEVSANVIIAGEIKNCKIPMSMVAEAIIAAKRQELARLRRDGGTCPKVERLRRFRLM